MEKKRILLVHNFYRIPGGEDTVFQNEKKLLEDNGNEVIEYTRNNNEVNNHIAKKILLPFISFFNIKTYLDIKRIIKKEKIDVVHVHNVLFLVSYAVFFVCFRRRIPVVQTIHNFRLVCPNATLFCNGKVCEKCLKNKFFFSIKNKCYRNSRLQTIYMVLLIKLVRFFKIYKKVNLIFLTDFNKNKVLEANKFSKSAIFNANNCYVKPNFICNSFSIARHNNFKGNYCVFIGRIEENKGILFLAKRWKKEFPVLFVIGSGTKMEELKQICKNKNNIELLGQIRHSEIYFYLANAMFLVFPSMWYEGFPMIILEAFSCSIPVLVNDVGNGAEIVKEGINGFHFSFEKENDLDRALKLIVKEKNQKSNFEFNKYFREENNILLLLDIYDEILKK